MVGCGSVVGQWVDRSVHSNGGMVEEGSCHGGVVDQGGSSVMH